MYKITLNLKSKNNSNRYNWIVLLFLPIVSSSFAQMGPIWDLNNKLDDLKFELEMQKLERMNPNDDAANLWKWPINLKHLHDDDRGSHFVDPQSVLGDKQNKQANFYIVMPKVKSNQNGSYKAIGIFAVITCDMSIYQEIALTTYKPDYKVDKIWNLPTRSWKWANQQSPAEKKYMRYVCEK